jgi:hypothetical protein
MAQTEYTGADMTFTYDSELLGGLLKVAIDEQNAPAPEPLDVTTDTDTVYTYLADPLGARGRTRPSHSYLQDSTASYADIRRPSSCLPAQTGVLTQPRRGNANT